MTISPMKNHYFSKIVGQTSLPIIMMIVCNFSFAIKYIIPFFIGIIGLCSQWQCLPRAFQE